MKKYLKRSICVLMLLVLVITLLPCEMSEPVFADTTLKEDQADYDNLKNKMQSIKNRLEQINKDIAQAKADKASVLKQKRLLDEQIEAYEGMIETTQELITACNAKIAEQEALITDLDKKIDACYEMIKQRLIFAQETGDMEYIDFILGSSSLSDLLSRVEVMNDLFKNDEKTLEELTHHKNDLSNKKAQIEATKQQSVQLKQENEVHKQELEQKKKEAEEYLANLDKDVETLNKTAQEVQASKDQLDADMKALAAQIEEKSKMEYKGGDFIWPVPVKYSRISQKYKGKSHTGIDIPTNSTYVNTLATASGKVLVAGWHWSYGNYVVIYHGSGMQSLYAHLSKIYVKVNQEVDQGDVIGLTGNTGYSFGVHLHFIIYVNGAHVDPLKYVTQP